MTKVAERMYAEKNRKLSLNNLSRKLREDRLNL